MGPWDINFFLAAIPFQIVLILYFWLKRQMPLRESRVFMKLMVCNLGVLVSDLIAIYACLYWQEMGIAGFYFWNIVYFLFMGFLGYYFFLYVAETLHLFKRIPNWTRYVLALPMAAFVVAAASSPLTHLIFYLDPVAGYKNGPLYNLLYQVFVFYLAAGLVVTASCREHESGKRRLTLAVCLVALLVGLYIRNAFLHVMIFCYFVTVVIFLIFIVVRNPDLYLCTETGLLSRKGFMLVLSDWVGRRPFYGFGFVIRDYAEMRAIFGEDFMDAIMGEMGSFIRKQFPHFTRFYLKDGRFFLLTSRGSYALAGKKVIAERFREPWRRGQQTVTFDISFVTLDMGLSFPDAVSFAQVIHDAFAEAERPGNADVLVDEAYQDRVARQIHVRRLLDDALCHDKLDVFLQPLVSAETGNVVEAEALVRLRDSDGSLVPPCDFIPAAEESGSISRLGLQVFSKVCRFIQEGGLSACGLSCVNVNLSPVQCLQRNLPQQLEKTRKQYGAKPPVISSWKSRNSGPWPGRPSPWWKNSMAWDTPCPWMIMVPATPTRAA